MKKDKNGYYIFKREDLPLSLQPRIIKKDTLNDKSIEIKLVAAILFGDSPGENVKILWQKCKKKYYNIFVKIIKFVKNTRA